MDLILWRHADAEAAEVGQDDLQRALTSKGQRHAEKMADWLGRRMAHSTRVLVSPALRCRQTADALGRKVRAVAAVGPSASVEDLLAAAGWPSASEPVLVVGHQPTLGACAAMLLTGFEQEWPIKKGSIWWLRHRPRTEDGQVFLLAVQSPDCV